MQLGPSLARGCQGKTAAVEIVEQVGGKGDGGEQEEDRSQESENASHALRLGPFPGFCKRYGEWSRNRLESALHGAGDLDRFPALVSGGMAERFKAHAWKACWGGSPSRVRIPLPPPVSLVSVDPLTISTMRPRKGSQTAGFFMSSFYYWNPRYGLNARVPTDSPLSLCWLFWGFALAFWEAKKGFLLLSLERHLTDMRQLFSGHVNRLRS